MLKRLGISIVALALLLGCYAVYLRAFSRFRFPELADDYRPPNSPGGSVPSDDAMQKQNYARNVAERVFGKDSWQAKDEAIALYWLHNGVIIFIKEYDRVDEQSLRLTPFCLVYTEKPKSPGAASQIVTLQGNQAILEFDSAIDLIKVTGARPIGGKISGDVQVQADRATSDPFDDVVAYTDDLTFVDDEHRIWTQSPVRVVSADSVMTGVGGELLLKVDAAEKSSRDSMMFGGVRGFGLFKQVQINSLASATDGLMGDTKPAKKSAAKDEKKMPVSISCDGRFDYDIESTQAQFHRSVLMVRQTAETQFDRMFCDDLAVLFDKRDNATNSPADVAAETRANPLSLQFREAHATGRSVRILSDEQAIEAIGTEMHHDTRSAVTILRGDPEVVAAKAGNVIHGRELRFTTTAQGQRVAEAVGPGSLEARDGETREVKLHGRWTEWARIDPQSENREQQIITLQGDVEVEQPGRAAMNADRIKVWLSRVARSGGSAAATGVEGTNWQPARIEGIGHVFARSNQFQIEATSRLDMTFEDGPLPAKKPTDSNANGPAGSSASGDPPGGGTKRQRNQAANTAPAKQPAQLRADSIRVRAMRDGARVEVADAFAEGGVDLLQPSETDGGQPTVIKGRTLLLKRLADGNRMEVTGSPAHVEMSTYKVDGPYVGVDQPSGIAWVEGKGVMTSLSDSTLDGKKLAQPTPMTIAWAKGMFFSGKSGVAEFAGDVEARQANSSLRCNQLEAFLTEPIDIAAPRPGKSSSAKINRLIGTGDVQFDTGEFENGQLQKFEHLEAGWFEYTTADGLVKSRGPGLVRMYSRGQGGLMPGPAASAKPAADKNGKDGAAAANQLHMTEIHFSDRMEGIRSTQIAKFFGHIQVVHVPVKDENEVVNPDNLPAGSMRLSCEELEVGSRPGAGSKSFYEMIGTGNVRVEAREFYGNGDRISFNQRDDLLIFESRPGSLASLYRQSRIGEKPDESRAEKIFYYRRDGLFRLERGVMVDFREREADRKDLQKAPTKKL